MGHLNISRNCSRTISTCNANTDRRDIIFRMRTKCVYSFDACGRIERSQGILANYFITFVPCSLLEVLHNVNTCVLRCGYVIRNCKAITVHFHVIQCYYELYLTPTLNISLVLRQISLAFRKTLAS